MKTRSVFADRQDALHVTYRMSSLLWVLAVVNFLVGLGAFMVVALLTPIQTSLGITTSQTGLLVSVYALAYAIGSPLGMAITAQLNRKTVLIVCLGIFSLSCLLVAGAGNYTTLIGARVLTALAAGLITPVTAAIAVSQSTESNMGRSLARVFLGFTMAQALGIPIAGLLGQIYGWTVLFYIVALLSLTTTVGLLLHMPRCVSSDTNNLSVLKELLLDWKALVSVLSTTTFIAGIYVLYTYIEPLLTQSPGTDRQSIALGLFVFGCGAVIGNHLGGVLNDRIGSVRTLYWLCGIQGLIMPLFSSTMYYQAPLLVLIFGWSIFSWSFMVPQQSRLVRRSPHHHQMLLALNASAIYLGAAIGSVIGGIVIKQAGIESLGITGGSICLLALVHIHLIERSSGDLRACSIPS